MLRAGFARCDITPPRDVGLMGYAFRQEQLTPGNHGIHDPLLCRVLILDDGTGPAALVSLDLCVLRTETARGLRRLVAAQVGTSPDRVMVACTHTHSGPTLGEVDVAHETGRRAEPDLPDDASPEKRYAAALPEKVRDTAARAAFRLYPVTAACQEAALGLSYVRRVRTGAGLAHCWSPHEQDALAPEPMPDPTCTVLVLRQVEGPRQYVLWSAGGHGVGLGPVSNCVSADWPGLACAAIEAANPDAHAVFLAGASGDLHPWIATQERADYLAPVARAAAAFVGLLAWGTRGGEQTLATAAETVALAGHELDLAAWRIGPCRIAALPVELFSPLGLALRERVGGPLALSTVTNGWERYWPTREAFDEGGYEVEIARRYGLEPGDGERLVEAMAAVVARV